MEVIIQPNSEAAADFVSSIIATHLLKNTRAVLGLATGASMESVYSRLVELHRTNSLDFSKCRTFNLDEYVGLSAEDPCSYRYYMNKHLFNQVNIDLQNTHIPNGIAPDLAIECEGYEKHIREVGGIDLMLLGIGLCGHIGFNEPLSAFRSRTRVVRLSQTTLQQNQSHFSGRSSMPQCAITMGVETILESRCCVLLATGENKADILARAIEGPLTSMVSASALQLHPDCIVVTDEAAASQLKEVAYYRWLYSSDPKWEAFRKGVTNR